MKNVPYGVEISLSFGLLPIASSQERLAVNPSVLYTKQQFGSRHKAIKIVYEEGILLYSSSTTSR
jgi:hypothetical protein